MNTTCRLIGAVETCVTPAQVSACAGKLDLDGCDAEDPSKRCLDGACVQPCGNGAIDEAAGEACDDANLVAQDGCSPTCHLEGCGGGEIDFGLGEECDDGVASVSGDGCSSTCQIERPEWSELVQEHISFLADHAMALLPADPTTGRPAQLVLFGGIGPDGIVGDTWVWTGTDQSPAWKQKRPARSPSPRHGHRMTYDGARKRVLLFGGDTVNGLADDLWEWDGEVWTELTPLGAGARKDAGFAYDPQRSVTVLFGGNTQQGPITDTWEWNGTTWTNKLLVTPPLSNRDIQLAYDSTRNALIYCGVPDAPSTWKYDGTWTNLNVPCTYSTSYPSNRMAYDPRRGMIALVRADGDVYEWNGAAWAAAETLSGNLVFGTAVADDGTRLVMYGGHASGSYATGGYNSVTRIRSATTGFTTATGTGPLPGPRYGGGTAYDTRRKRAVMYGGAIGSGGVWTVLRDTWQFDDDLWNRIGDGIGAGPLARYQHAMAYDAERDAIVMFGGTTSPPNTQGTITLLDDTWLMNPAGTWQQVTSGTSPSVRRGAAITYDSARKHVVLFGGDPDASQTIYNRLNDTWVWDGTSWTQLNPPASPSVRAYAVMAYDPVRDRIVLFGGNDGQSSYHRDTWEWDGSQWTLVDEDGPPTPQAPSSRGEASMVYDPLRKRIVLLGGGAVRNDASHYSDVWEWDGSNWTEILDDQRLARVGGHAFFDPIFGGIVFYGGEISTASGYSPETWLLRYESFDTRETCRFPEDDFDGDGFAGCVDPDCAPRCSACGNGVCEPFEDHVICDGDCN